MAQPLRVDVPRLRVLGGEVVAAGEELTRNVAAVADQLSPPSGPGVAGWAAFAALTGAGQGWRGFLDGLAGRTAQAGRSLISAADNYQAADQRAAARHQ